MHRWLGLFLALPLLWLALSGFLLNHVDQFGLRDRQLKSQWILNHYYPLPSGTPLGLSVGERKVQEWDEFIFLDGEVLDLSGELVGAVPYQSNLIVVTRERLVLIDEAGQIILEHDQSSLPPLPLKNVSLHEEVLMVESGQRWWKFSENLQENKWSQTPPESYRKPSPLNKEEVQALKEKLQNRGFIPLSQVLLDAHSGQLFGWIGVFLNDLAVVGIVLLVFLGLRLFPSRKDGNRRTVLEQPSPRISLGSDHSKS